MGIKPMPVSQCSGTQTAEYMKAKWLDINKGLKDKDTCMIWRAAFEYTYTHATWFFTKKTGTQYWNVTKGRQDHVSFLV
jgi:hypothetical protein